MSSVKSTSLKIYIARYLLVIFVVVLASAVVSYLFYKHDYEQLQISDQHNSLIHTAENIGRLIRFHQGVVDSIARQHVVLDLLQFGTHEQAMQWANEIQKLIPDAIGMALFEPDGSVRGTLSELRLSDQCMMDMHARVQGRPVLQPPVHYKIEALAHFDIISPIKDAEGTTGLVFASFSTKIITDVLNDVVGGNQELKVIAPGGYVVAKAGQLDLDEGAYTESFNIQGTDWVLETKYILEKSSRFVSTLSLNNIVIFVLLTILFVIAMSRFFKIIIADFEIISNMMRHIQDGSFERHKVQRAHLAETEGIIAYMRFLATELALHQKKIHDASITDELTGLHNRRVLNQEIERCIGLAKQGESVGLVILDLDHFKMINDTSGHDIGDQILIMLAETLRESCKEKDTCVRVGGDEFIIILLGYDQKKINEWYMSVLNILQQRVYAIKEKLGPNSQCGISAGFTMITKEDDRGSLLKRADMALYEAKDKGRCNIQFAK